MPKKKDKPKGKTIYSPRQTIAAKKLSETIRNSRGKNITLGKILRDAGYSESFAKTPSRVINAKGFQRELKNYGFDVDTAKKEVGKILTKGKETNRILAAREVFKINSAYAPEKQEQTITHKFEDLTDEQLSKQIDDKFTKTEQNRTIGTSK